MKLSQPWNVLVFPGGTENGLEIYRSLCYAKEVILFSASNSVENHAEYVYRNHQVIPDIYQADCLEQLNRVIHDSQIDYIFPANSLIIDFLIEHREEVRCEILLPASSTVKLVRSKRNSYKILKNIVRTPQVFNKQDEVSSYPIFLKPDQFYGSQGTRMINGPSEISADDFSRKDLILSEYLPGREFTIDCFSNDGKVLYSMARERGRVRMGTTMHTSPAPSAVQTATAMMASIISDKLNIHGLWFYQVKEDSNRNLCLLEVETRVAGTMALSRAMGVNLPLANLYLHAGCEVNLHKQRYELTLDRCLATNYKTNISYQSVYIDLDDTIVVKGRLNLDAVKFLYQCFENHIPVILLSKSQHPEPDAYLRKLKIDQLFNKVYWLLENQSKADFIEDVHSIFIDDSFSQRAIVEAQHGIPTFEPGMIDVLLDMRKS